MLQGRFQCLLSVFEEAPEESGGAPERHHQQGEDHDDARFLASSPRGPT